MKYCNNNKIPYAIDSSNNNTIYLRNKFRHKVLPIYKEINKDAHLKFLQYSLLLNKYDDFVNKYVNNIYNNIVSDYLNIPFLLKEDDLIVDNIIYKYLSLFSDQITSKHIELVKRLFLLIKELFN